MSHEHVPNQAEIYFSYLVATNIERMEGVFLLKNECDRRYDLGIARFEDDGTTSFKVYERRILKRLRIRLIPIEQ